MSGRTGDKYTGIASAWKSCRPGPANQSCELEYPSALPIINSLNVILCFSTFPCPFP